MAEQVELIREAARLMRQRAEAAPISPWVPDGSEIYAQYAGGPWVGETLKTGEAAQTDADAEHIASWHPGVALAVAALLDSLADDIESQPGAWLGLEMEVATVELARAYLGKEPS